MAAKGRRPLESCHLLEKVDENFAWAKPRGRVRRRECQLGETTRDEVTHRMKRALEIMRSSALTPLKTPVKSMGGLIGGEAKKLAQHMTQASGETAKDSKYRDLADQLN